MSVSLTFISLGATIPAILLSTGELFITEAAYTGTDSYRFKGVKPESFFSKVKLFAKFELSIG
jgi:hypothetical protein